MSNCLTGIKRKVLGPLTDFEVSLRKYSIETAKKEIEIERDSKPDLHNIESNHVKNEFPA